MEPLEPRDLLSLSPVSWTEIGPRPVESTRPSNPPFAGRINVAIADPNDPNTVYVAGDGSASYGQGSGIWKTTTWQSASPTWTPLIDNQPSMDIGAHGLTMFSGNSQILYAAAGGPNGGILKTTNGGDTWTELSTNLFSLAAFGAIVVHPTNSNIVYVASEGNRSAAGGGGGIFKSTDGGMTFAPLLPSTFGAYSATDLAITLNSADQSVILYAGILNAGPPAQKTINGVYQIDDQSSGVTATQLTNGIESGASIGSFIALAMAPSNNQVLYATLFNPSNSSTTPSLTRYRTADGGASWITLNITPDKSSDYRTWHTVLAVDPSNENLLFANGAEPLLYQGVYTGNPNLPMNWDAADNTNENKPIEIYEDSVQVFFDDSGAAMLVADRGILRGTFDSSTAAWTFENKRQDLATTLLYDVAASPADPQTVYAISQDQFAILQTTGNIAWQELSQGNEIGSVLVNPVNPQTLYNLEPIDDKVSPVAGPLYRSDDGGTTWVNATNNSDIVADFSGSQIGEFDEQFFRALAVDPLAPSNAVLGSFGVYGTTNQGDSWAHISPTLVQDPDFLSTFGIGHTQQGSTLTPIYFTGSLLGKVFLSPPNPDATTPWIERDTGLPAATIRQIAVNPETVLSADSKQLFLVMTKTGPGRVWMSMSGGQAWTDVTGDLPSDYETETLAVDWRFATPHLFVGTMRGVYISTDLGQHWTVFGQALPNTQVRDLDFLPQENVLTAGTYGRGAFQILVQAPTQTALTASPNPATVGQTIILTASVQPSTTTTLQLTGNVVFFDGNVSLGSGVLNASGMAQITVHLAGGNHSLTAQYTGDSNFLPSSSASLPLTVNPAPATVTLSASQTSSNPSAPIIFTAQVTSSANILPGGLIEFFDGTTFLGNSPIANGKASLATTQLSIGQHFITAQYPGNSNFQASVSPVVPVEIGSLDQRFVNHAYQALLHRNAELPGLLFWSQLVEQGVARSTVALGIEQSAEFIVGEVNALYVLFLHRAADPVGLTSYASYIATGGAIENVLAILFGSQEYFVTRSGSTDLGYLQTLYQDAFHRSLDPIGLATFGLLLARGASRTQIALLIVNSVEGTIDRVNDYYLAFLQRPADPAGLAWGTGLLLSGVPDNYFISLLIGSDEFLATS